MPVTRSQMVRKRSTATEDTGLEEPALHSRSSGSSKAGNNRDLPTISKALNGNSSPAVVFLDSTMAFGDSPSKSSTKSEAPRDSRVSAHLRSATTPPVPTGRRRLFPIGNDTSDQDYRKSAEFQSVPTASFSALPVTSPASFREDARANAADAVPQESGTDVILDGATKESSVNDTHVLDDSGRGLVATAERLSPDISTEPFQSSPSPSNKVVRKLTFFSSPSSSISYLVSPPKPVSTKVSTKSPNRSLTPRKATPLLNALPHIPEVLEANQTPKSGSATGLTDDPETEMVLSEPTLVTDKPTTSEPDVLPSKDLDSPDEPTPSVEEIDRIKHIMDVLNKRITDDLTNPDVSAHAANLKVAIQQGLVLPGKDTILLTEILEQECVGLLNLCLQYVLILPEWFIAKALLIATSGISPRPEETPWTDVDQDKLKLIENSIVRAFNNRNMLRALRKLPFQTVLQIVQFILHQVELGHLSVEAKTASWLSVLVESHFYGWVLADDEQKTLLKAQNLLSELVDVSFLCLEILGQMDVITAASGSRDVTRKTESKYWHTTWEY